MFIDFVKITIRNQDIKIYDFFRVPKRDLCNKEDWLINLLMDHNMVEWSIEKEKYTSTLYMYINLQGNWIDYNFLYNELDQCLQKH